jgi:hypothetical protein
LKELKAGFAFLDNEDFCEGFSAFLEKAQPPVPGRVESTPNPPPQAG